MLKLLLFVFLTAILGCSPKIEETKLKRVTAAKARELVQTRNPKTSVLIDGRPSKMFSGGHIEEAVQIDAFGSNVQEALKPFLNRDQIILYCTTNKRSNTLVDLLEKLQFAGEIIVIADGLTGWKAAGYKIVRSDQGA